MLKKIATISFIFTAWITVSLLGGPIQLFSGSANHPLSEEISDYLNLPLGELNLGRFNDGEASIKVNESVRNKDVFVVQSTCSTDEGSVNDHLMELYLLVRTLKRASVNSVTVVMPYYGYARQDRKTSPRVPISASDVAFLLESAGTDRVVAVDLHCGQIQGFFQKAPVDNLYASTVFVPYMAKKKLKKLVVVSPDAGGVERAKFFQERLIREGMETDLAVIVKQRGGAGVVSRMNLVGNVMDADVVIVDDICDTGGTLVKAAQLLKDSGAKGVYACVTHPVFSDPALARIEDSVLTEMIVMDTIPITAKLPHNVTQLSIAPLLGEAILRINSGDSISTLFN